MQATQKEFVELIESFTGQANILTIPRVLLEYLENDHIAALFLSQLLYWNGKGDRPDGGIAKTFNEWEAELGITKYQVYRSLKLMPYIKTKVHRFKGNPTVHYYLDTALFLQSFVEFLNKRKVKELDEPQSSLLPNHSVETSHSLTETTPKITSKTTSNTNQSRKSHNPFIAQMQEYLGYPLKTNVDPIPNPGKEAQNIKKMLSRGFQWPEILALWCQKCDSRNEFVSMVWVNEDIRKAPAPVNDKPETDIDTDRITSLFSRTEISSDDARYLDGIVIHPNGTQTGYRLYRVYRCLVLGESVNPSVKESWLSALKKLGIKI